MCNREEYGKSNRDWGWLLKNLTNHDYDYNCFNKNSQSIKIALSILKNKGKTTKNKNINFKNLTRENNDYDCNWQSAAQLIAQS